EQAHSPSRGRSFVESQHDYFCRPDNRGPLGVRKAGGDGYFLRTVRHVGDDASADCTVKRLAPKLLSTSVVNGVEVAAYVAEEKRTRAPQKRPFYKLVSLQRLTDTNAICFLGSCRHRETF